MDPREISELEDHLDWSPDDWAARIRLIEHHVREGRMDDARRLVRDSPDTVPVPPGIQYRLHQLLSQGTASPTTTSGHEQDAPASAPATTEPVDPPDSDPEPRSTALDPPAGEDTRSPATRLSGRHGAAPVAAPPVLRVHRRPESEETPGAGTDEDGLHMELYDLRSSANRPDAAPQKISALTMAFFVHIVLFFLLASVYIAMPAPAPPEFVVSISQLDREVPIDNPQLIKNQEHTPASAAAQATQVVSTISPSPVAIPKFDRVENTDVTTNLIGLGAAQGLSLKGDGAESNVNFFGIDSGGNRIAFIIDAAPFMLVDEKGGMYAYDKVKAEITTMLAALNRGTSFNILLYEGSRLALFREKPVPALPSNVNLAGQWLDPLNRDYSQLGLRSGYEADGVVSPGIEPILHTDISGYAKAIQAALEMKVSTVFVIASGYQTIRRIPTPEMRRKMQESRTPGTPPSAADQQAWARAQQKTREWLRKENEERQKRGLPPKVVTDFTQLVRQITGQTPPRGSGGGGGIPGPRPYTPEEIEAHIADAVKKLYKTQRLSPPSINIVVFLGTDEEMGAYKDHFREITRKNAGKLKVLEGLAALEDVTGKG